MRGHDERVTLVVWRGACAQCVRGMSNGGVLRPLQPKRRARTCRVLLDKRRSAMLAPPMQTSRVMCRQNALTCMEFYQQFHGEFGEIFRI
eukprot:3372391-Prymnesium_polylepis.1